jgi:hypothetical protein
MTTGRAAPQQVDVARGVSVAGCFAGLLSSPVGAWSKVVVAEIFAGGRVLAVAASIGAVGAWRFAGVLAFPPRVGAHLLSTVRRFHDHACDAAKVVSLDSVHCGLVAWSIEGVLVSVDPAFAAADLLPIDVQ